MQTAWPHQLVVRLLSQRGPESFNHLERRMPGSSLGQEDIRFTSDAVPADVVVVVNYLKYDDILEARKGFFWNWHNEPLVRLPFSKGYDRIYTHQDSIDPRAYAAPPILDWWIDKSYDELVEMPPPRKTQKLSVIASTKSFIEGHRARGAFVANLERAIPELQIFGRGRARELPDKYEGLGPFEFSVAIENTSKADYWTEKIADCFLSYTVPIYFGCTNLEEYFPRDSYIWLPLDDPGQAVSVVKRVLREESWIERVPALIEARRRVLNSFSLFGQLSSRIRAEADTIRAAEMQARRVHGRRTQKGGWIRGAGAIENVAAQYRRLQSRYF